jgi:hypothetical protein
LIFFLSLGAAIASFAGLELSFNMKKIMTSVKESLLKEYQESYSYLDLHHLINTKFQSMPSITFYSYGSPRVGNQSFGNKMTKYLSTIYRIKVNGDLVTMVPKLMFGFYRHFGVPVIIDEYEHGNIIINPSMIEDSFFRRTTGNLTNHSLEKYRTCLESVFESHELSEYISNEFNFS